MRASAVKSAAAAVKSTAATAARSPSAASPGSRVDSAGQGGRQHDDDKDFEFRDLEL
jgi:hypothetical protein